jgi:hypothetical protein
MSLNYYYYFWNKMADPRDKLLATPSQALWHRAGWRGFHQHTNGFEPQVKGSGIGLAWFSRAHQWA